MAHPSIPKSEPQETSGVSLGASVGSSAPGSAGFSETWECVNHISQTLNQFKWFLYKVWCGLIRSNIQGIYGHIIFHLNLQGFKSTSPKKRTNNCQTVWAYSMVQSCYKIKNPEAPLPGNSIRSKCAICNNGTSQHSQIRAPRNIRCFLRRIGCFFCTGFRWLLWNLKWLGMMKVYIRFQFAWVGESISMYIIVYLPFQYPVCFLVLIVLNLFDLHPSIYTISIEHSPKNTTNKCQTVWAYSMVQSCYKIKNP